MTVRRRKAFEKIAAGLNDVRSGRVVSLKGFRIKDGKLERIQNYGLSASMKLQQKKSKRVRPVKRKP